MSNYIDKLNKLSNSSIWSVAKQSIVFETAFKAVNLLSEMPNRETENIEIYFNDNYQRYEIPTHRHRVLLMAQFFGLLTKTPFYKQNKGYSKEQPTEIFYKLKQYNIGSKEYNTIKTEQILKLKIKAITDRMGGYNWNVLPVIFCYQVLKKLQREYNISTVALDNFLTYVMTCSEYKEVDEAVEFIKNNSPASSFSKIYKDKSRILNLFINNFCLFDITADSISINKKYDDYFNDMFIEKFDIDELNSQLSRDVDYAYFLTTYQNFNINLIDEPLYDLSLNNIHTTLKLRKKRVVITDNGNIEDDDIDYINKVNEVKDNYINPDIVHGASKIEPIIKYGNIAKRYSKNPIIGKVAIQNVNYKCENDENHSTFISNLSCRPFMEAHHLIPICYQDEIWDRFGKNIDCIENIISLCPNCHRAIHYATEEEKINLITKLYNKKISILMNIGIRITLDELMAFYFK